METVTATLEWHYYCPKCERSCLTRFSGNVETFKNTCSDCGTVYEIQLEPLTLDKIYIVCPHRAVVNHPSVGTVAECEYLPSK